MRGEGRVCDDNDAKCEAVDVEERLFGRVKRGSQLLVRVMNSVVA